MFTPLTVILVICAYMALLFALAQWTEKQIASNKRGAIRLQPWVYGFSIVGVYVTAWSYYGNVGLAVNNGLIYLAATMGGCLMVVVWWFVLRRIVQLKAKFHITSIADFISVRYNRSHWVAALVTLMALIGSIPYISLQLKAVVTTYGVITAQLSDQLSWHGTGLLIVILLAAFIILFGVRRLDPTERHQGVMFALAAEAVIKLLAFTMVGLYAVYGLFDGFQDLWQQAAARLEINPMARLAPPDSRPYLLWMTFFIMSLASIQFLPRQFHVCAVENADIRHIRTAMRVVPPYLLLFNLFVPFIGAAGLLIGLSPTQADSYVLLLPLLNDQATLTLLTFIGGVSAAIGMITISTMTLSTMTTNHLLLPLIESRSWLQPLRHYLLPCRWLAVLLILLAGYAFAWAISDLMLANLGFLAFAATMQFIPAIIGMFLWRNGSARGVMLGLSCGFIVWFYTLIVPVLATHGWLPASLLSQGPWELSWLRPQALLGVEGLPVQTHSLFWSLAVNIGAFVAGSLALPPDNRELSLTAEFLQAGERSSFDKTKPKGLREYIELAPKLEEVEELLGRYLPQKKVEQHLHTIMTDLALNNRTHITIMELVEFHHVVEHVLSGSIGSAAAHRAIETSIKYSEREVNDLQAIYSDVLGVLLTTPQELSQQVDYTSTEAGSTQSRLDELESKIREREAEIHQLRRQVQEQGDHMQELKAQNQTLQGQHLQLSHKLSHERSRTSKLMRLLKREIRRRGIHSKVTR